MSEKWTCGKGHSDEIDDDLAGYSATIDIDGEPMIKICGRTSAEVIARRDRILAMVNQPEGGSTLPIPTYDLNWQFGQQIVEITLQVDDFSARHFVAVGGNCLGVFVLDCAPTMLADRLMDETMDGVCARVTLTNAQGEELLCVDEEADGEDWLRQMVTGLRIVGYQARTRNEIRKRNGAAPVDGGDVKPAPIGTVPAA